MYLQHWKVYLRKLLISFKLYDDVQVQKWH